MNHLGHGLGVGDKVHLTGLDSTGFLLRSDWCYSDGQSSLVVDSADTAGYFVQLADSFNEASVGSVLTLPSTNQAFNYDWMVPSTIKLKSSLCGYFKSRLYR